MLHLVLVRHTAMMWIVWIVSALFLETDAKQKFREDNADYWIMSGQTRLHSELRRQQEAARSNGKVAKNVILFVGDGMGMSTITATRIYKNQLAGGYGEEKGLSFEEFPFVGLAKTYEVNFQVPDSAGTATAMLTGVKINANVTGLDARAKYEECDPYINEKAKLENLITWAQAAGKDTGFVTTTRVTHATVGAIYAHANNRYWECDSKVPKKCKNLVKDIARQLVEDKPGRVILPKRKWTIESSLICFGLCRKEELQKQHTDQAVVCNNGYTNTDVTLLVKIVSISFSVLLSFFILLLHANN